MVTKIAVQTSAMGGYITLRKLGHKSNPIQRTYVEIKTVRVKAEKSIYDQSKKSYLLSYDEECDPDLVVLSYISYESFITADLCWSQ